MDVYQGLTRYLILGKYVVNVVVQILWVVKNNPKSTYVKDKVKTSLIQLNKLRAYLFDMVNKLVF